MIGDKVMVRDLWIDEDWMVPPGIVIDIAYERGTNFAKVFLIKFENHFRWFNLISLKKE